VQSRDPHDCRPDLPRRTPPYRPSAACRPLRHSRHHQRPRLQSHQLHRSRHRRRRLHHRFRPACFRRKCPTDTSPGLDNRRPRCIACTRRAARCKGGPEACIAYRTCRAFGSAVRRTEETPTPYNPCWRRIRRSNPQSCRRLGSKRSRESSYKASDRSKVARQSRRERQWMHCHLRSALRPLRNRRPLARPALRRPVPGSDFGAPRCRRRMPPPAPRRNQRPRHRVPTAANPKKGIFPLHRTVAKRAASTKRRRRRGIVRSSAPVTVGPKE
jgi:hypothetical protein